MKTKTWINIILAIAVVAVFVVSFALGARHTKEGEEGFGGSDDAAENAITEIDPNYKPWFEPFFEPASGEVESGLFALQAAIGGLIFGYAAGALNTRRKYKNAENSVEAGKNS